MQLGTGTSGKSMTYINVVGGKFARKADKGAVGATARTNKLGVEVYEILTDWVAGYISDIQLNKSTEYGDSYSVVLDAGNETFAVQLGVLSKPGMTFAKVLPNIKLDEPVKLTLSTKKDEEGKDQVSLFVNQDHQEKPISWAYTNAEKNGLPDMVLVKVNGKDTYDKTAQLEFLWNMIETTIIPNLKGKPNTETENTLEETHGDLLATNEDAPF